MFREGVAIIVKSLTNSIWTYLRICRLPTEDRERNLLHSIKVASFNARTLTSNSRVSELQKLASDSSSDVICIQEHRRPSSSSVHQLLPPGWQLLLGETAQPGVGGIGFLLSPRCSNALLNFKFITSRIGLVSIDVGKRRLHVVCVYASTAAPFKQSDSKFFYDFLASTIASLPFRDLLFICGDFNAPLAADGIRVKNRCGVENENSPFLCSLVEQFDLFAANGVVRQKYSKLITRLDWIFCRKRDSASVKKVCNIRPSIVNSDNRLLSLSFAYRWRKKYIRPKQRDFNRINDHTIHKDFVNHFRRSIKNGFSFFDAAKGSIERVIPFKSSNRQNNYWLDNPLLNRSRNLAEAALRKYGNNSKEYFFKLSIHGNQFKVISETMANEMVDEISVATDQCKSATAWKAINRLTGRNYNSLNCLSSTSLENRKELLVQHYSGVLNSSSPACPLESLEQNQSNTESGETLLCSLGSFCSINFPSSSGSWPWRYTECNIKIAWARIRSDCCNQCSVKGFCSIKLR